MPSVSTTEVPCFAGLVLAGGASSRMGEDKALLTWQGRPLLQHAVNRLAEAGADPVLVSGDRPEWDGIPDTMPGRGPLGGLMSVLDQRPGLGDRIIAVVPVDVPGLSADALLTLVRAVTDGASAAHFESHPLPMALRASDRVKETLRDLLAPQGKGAVRELARRLDARCLAGDGLNLSNMNTPNDWDRFREAAN